MAQVDGSSFQAFAQSINSTIPETTSTIPEKKRVITAKKRILSHPNCPSKVKTELLKDIAKLETEIQKLEDAQYAEKHEQVINTSIFPTRNIG